jgi:hypothetical protein
MGFVRRSGRIAKEIRILLVGTDTSGHVFSEETTTVVLSLHGAGIISRHKLAADEILTLRLFGTSAEAGVRLVGQMGQETRGYTYGVEFLDPDLDFWELKFPPPATWHLDPDSALECNTCHAQQVIHQSEVEADVYALVQGILRFCPRCGTSTVWQQATAEREDRLTQTEAFVAEDAALSELGAQEAAVLASGSTSADSVSASLYSSEPTLTSSESETSVAVAIPEAVAFVVPPVPIPASLGRASNRRSSLRARVNFTALVRHGELGDDMAECDNISKGGISFRSRKAYPVGATIGVAVPYTPGWDPVFVPARITHVGEVPGGTQFRYGVAYTKTAKNKPEF